MWHTEQTTNKIIPEFFVLVKNKNYTYVGVYLRNTSLSLCVSDCKYLHCVIVSHIRDSCMV